jgi:hypothetical protein
LKREDKCNNNKIKYEYSTSTIRKSRFKKEAKNCTDVDGKRGSFSS